MELEISGKCYQVKKQNKKKKRKKKAPVVVGAVGQLEKKIAEMVNSMFREPSIGEEKKITLISTVPEIFFGYKWSQNSSMLLYMVSVFNVISTFLGYLMPKLSM